MPPSAEGVSFPARLPVNRTSSVALIVSAEATGTSSTAATFTVTVAVDTEPVESVSV